MEKNPVTKGNQEQIWTPEYFLENESGSKVNTMDFGTKMYIDRQSGAIPDSPERLKEGRK